MIGQKASSSGAALVIGFGMNFVSMLPPDIVFPLQSLEDRLLEAVRGGEMPRDPVNFAPRFVNQGLPQDTSRPLSDV